MSAAISSSLGRVNCLSSATLALAIIKDVSLSAHKKAMAWDRHLQKCVAFWAESSYYSWRGTAWDSHSYSFLHDLSRLTTLIGLRQTVAHPDHITLPQCLHKDLDLDCHR